jgi:hypothetical protein
MKIKKEYTVLTLIIIALLLYLTLRDSDRTLYQLPRLDSIDGKSITKIEILFSDESIVLSKSDDQWFIGPEAYPADSSKVQNMVNVIENLAVTTMVSSSKNFDRYDLDDDGKISVKVWRGNTIDREFDIGKSATTYRHTHVRLPGDPNVYHAEGNFRSTFDNKTEDLRDRTVLSFDTRDIREIHVDLEKKEFQISQLDTAPDLEQPETPQTEDADTEQPDQTKPRWQTTEGKKVDESKLQELMAFLSKLDCEGYIEDKIKEDFQNPVFSITLRGAEDHTLRIFSQTGEADQPYPAVSSQNDYPFTLPAFKVDNIKKKVEELLP